MKCECGYEVKTPFCPICGKGQPNDPARQLLAHCRATLHSQEVRVKRGPRYVDQDGWEGSKMQRGAARAAAKWSSWVAALEALIDA